MAASGTKIGEQPAADDWPLERKETYQLGEKEKWVNLEGKRRNKNKSITRGFKKKQRRREKNERESSLMTSLPTSDSRWTAKKIDRCDQRVSTLVSHF